MRLKGRPDRADSMWCSDTEGDKTVFKLRRRTVAETAASDHPYCGMCGTTMRVDAASGRCALGHRVAAPGALVVPVVEDQPAAVIGDAPVYDATAVVPDASSYGDTANVYVGEGLYEAYSSADASGRAVTWDDVVAPATGGPSSVYDDYLSWSDSPSNFSSLDFDSDGLPTADVVEDAAPYEASDLLGELDGANNL